MGYQQTSFGTILKSSYGLWHYRDGLGEACYGDIAFANALETFGGGHDDPISVAVGGSSSIVVSCYNLQNREQVTGFLIKVSLLIVLG